MTKTTVVMLMLCVIAALPLVAQSTTAPVAEIIPEHPRDANVVTIVWSQKVLPSMKFDAPEVPATGPWTSTYPGYMTYGTTHTITIRQTARPDANGESEHRESALIYVEAGTYTINLELTVMNESGSYTFRYPITSFVVPSSCYPAANAFTTYSSDRGGYVLHYNALLASNEGYSYRGTVTIEGDHITVRQPMTSGDVAPLFWRCVESTLDVGSLAPGLYRLTWITDTTFGLGPPGVFESIRELSVEVEAPRRRTSRR